LETVLAMALALDMRDSTNSKPSSVSAGEDTKLHDYYVISMMN
jgi:hypothetical protein